MIGLLYFLFGFDDKFERKWRLLLAAVNLATGLIQMWVQLQQVKASQKASFGATSENLALTVEFKPNSYFFDKPNRQIKVNAAAPHTPIA